MDFETTAMITGHRPGHFGPFAYDRNSPIRQRTRQVFQVAVGEAVDRGFRTFISGMALGADQDFAQVVLEFRSIDPSLQLVAAVPCLGQDSKWGWADKRFYAQLLAQADETVLVSNRPFDKWVMQERNTWMVDRSKLVIALFDGLPGGTANCVRYAEGLQREIVRIDPQVVL